MKKLTVMIISLVLASIYSVGIKAQAIANLGP